MTTYYRVVVQDPDGGLRPLAAVYEDREQAVALGEAEPGDYTIEAGTLDPDTGEFTPADA